MQAVREVVPHTNVPLTAKQAALLLHQNPPRSSIADARHPCRPPYTFHFIYQCIPKMKILHYIIVKIGFEILNLLYFLVRWFVVALLLTYGLRWLGVSEGANRTVNTVWFVLIAAWSVMGYILMKKRAAQRERDAVESAPVSHSRVLRPHVDQSIWQRNGSDQHVHQATGGAGQHISWATQVSKPALEQAEEPSSTYQDYTTAREETIKTIMDRLGASREDAEKILRQGNL